MKYFLVLVYIISLIPYLNCNHINPTIGTLDPLVVIIPGRMDIHIYVCMRKELNDAISTIEFFSMTINSKFTKVVRYIHNKKHLGDVQCSSKNISPNPRFLCLIDDNESITENLYYHSIMNKH